MRSRVRYAALRTRCVVQRILGIIGVGMVVRADKTHFALLLTISDHRIGMFATQGFSPGFRAQSHMKCRGHSRPAASRVKLRSADPRLQETDPNRDACGVGCS